jgi:endonuclease III
MPKRFRLGPAVAALRKHYGPPAEPATTDPFELILWENVAYLASPARRREAFDLLRRTVGTRPAQILAAKGTALAEVTSHGILAGTSMAKLRECARIAIEKFDGDLEAVITQPLGPAKKALRMFPGIGEPGAEKILLFTGHQARLAPDSNALRVLVRLGLVREEKSYSRTYAASAQVAEDLPKKPAILVEAHLLLQQHGQTLCKRSAPLCAECPLSRGCAYAARGGAAV